MCSMHSSRVSFYGEGLQLRSHYFCPQAFVKPLDKRLDVFVKLLLKGKCLERFRCSSHILLKMGLVWRNSRESTLDWSDLWFSLVRKCPSTFATWMGSEVGNKCIWINPDSSKSGMNFSIHLNSQLSGCEKFVLKFPLHVLSSFIDSFAVAQSSA